ncbi:hypothetical protein BDV29DRAFT_63649 [Aspergillus leporis]|uniref:Uncharacterized protein n=1 Tax=Aspergillus leporis TaxID=41062 RepID=A0A5N5WNF7_9EURO|nr:hypothetical protein BDV29DRAFT_63649 [Aspergillus leporis]
MVFCHTFISLGLFITLRSTFRKFLESFTASCEPYLYSLLFYLPILYTLFYFLTSTGVSLAFYSLFRILGGFSHILKISVTGSGYVSCYVSSKGQEKGKKKKEKGGKKKNLNDLCHCVMGS